MKVKFNDEDLINMLLGKIPEVNGVVFPEFLFSSYIIYGAFGAFYATK
jgi:hypothetical protein